jgi:hypothetical protein
MVQATLGDSRRAPSVQDAQIALIGRLQQNRPHPMAGWHVANALDFEDRATHLQRIEEAIA